MIPIMGHEGPIWVVGIGWHADLMASFLAWWMPLNLASWLVVLITVPLMTGQSWKEQVFTLRHILLMTVIFWPDLVGRVVYVLLTHHFYMRNRRARAKAALEDF